MRKVLLVLVVVLLLVPVAAVALVFLALEDTPRVERPVAFTPEHVERAKRIVEGQHPSRKRSGTLGTVSITAEDADLAANYLADRFARGSAQVALDEGSARVRVSVPLPDNPAGRYLNVAAVLVETGELPLVRSVRVGPLPLPDFVAAPLVARAMGWLRSRREVEAGLSAVRSVRLSAGGVNVVYEWQEDLPDRVRAAAITPEDRARLRFYQERLAALPRTATTSLAALLAPMMAAAAERSARGDAGAENRALLTVLTVHVLGKSMEIVDPEAATWPKAARRTVTLANRDDFPKHFLVSAAIAAHAGDAMADAIGLWKEVDDSRGGSGFSFNDIAADKAGTRFGTKAVSGAAAEMQKRFAGGMKESDILPPTADLPEFMPEAEFKSRFGGVGAPAYRKMMEEIERRVAALPM